MHTKKALDTNDVTLVRISKDGQFMEPKPNDKETSEVSLQEIFGHKLLNAMFSSFTFSRLRTMKLAESNKSRYVVSGSIGGTGTYFTVDVIVQTDKENLDDVMKEIDTHIFKDFSDFMKKMDSKSFETYRSSVLSLLKSPGDDLGDEFSHFAAVLEEPLDRDITECDWQTQRAKTVAVKALTLPYVQQLWEGFLDKKATRKQVVLHHDPKKILDEKKTTIAYMHGKQNPDNLDYYPGYGGVLDCRPTFGGGSGEQKKLSSSSLTQLPGNTPAQQQPMR